MYLSGHTYSVITMGKVSFSPQLPSRFFSAFGFQQFEYNICMCGLFVFPCLEVSKFLRYVVSYFIICLLISSNISSAPFFWDSTYTCVTLFGIVAQLLDDLLCFQSLFSLPFNLYKFYCPNFRLHDSSLNWVTFREEPIEGSLHFCYPVFNF